MGGHQRNVADPKRELLNAWPSGGQKLSDRGVGTKWGQQLNLRALVWKGDHGFTHPLTLIYFCVMFVQAEDPLEKIPSGAQIGHRNSDVINTKYQVCQIGSICVIHKTNLPKQRAVNP